jgi:hypothetical protein
MPLEVTLLGPDGKLLDRVTKSSQGEFLHDVASDGMPA